jgi:HEPN domain-containing protein
MKTIRASLNVRLGKVQFTHTEEDAFFAVAQELMKGARVLALSGSDYALTFLCCHILECLLKAFLSKMGLTEAELKKKPFGHNLLNLWNEAIKKGLLDFSDPPSWVNILDRLHCDHYILRYPMGLIVVGYPAIEPMMTDLEKLFLVIGQFGESYPSARFSQS